MVTGFVNGRTGLKTGPPVTSIERAVASVDLRRMPWPIILHTTLHTLHAGDLRKACTPTATPQRLSRHILTALWRLRYSTVRWWWRSLACWMLRKPLAHGAA